MTEAAIGEWSHEMKSAQTLNIPAIEVCQSEGRKLYSFALDGKIVPTIATVSRLRRADGALHGYQRPEILSHISEIRGYLESPSPMIPNSIVLAFDSRVFFEPDGHGPRSEYSRTGVLHIPYDPELPDENKPGFVVDGQQRLAAIRDARIDSFPVTVTAFITDDVKEQTEQFMLVNSTRPLPKGLIYELLPGTDTRLPGFLERRKFPARLLEQLNMDESSPLFQKIKTPTNPDGVIKDNAILKMLENSLSDGVLYRYRSPGEDAPEDREMLRVLNAFWTATAAIFPEAWTLPPRKSRLVHGAGVVSMGFLMDAIADRLFHSGANLDAEDFKQDLLPLRDTCRWTNGYWDFGPGRQRKWNEIQNTPSDVQLLSNYLLVQYKRRVWSDRSSSLSTQPT